VRSPKEDLLLGKYLEQVYDLLVNIYQHLAYVRFTEKIMEADSYLLLFFTPPYLLCVLRPEHENILFFETPIKLKIDLYIYFSGWRLQGFSQR
jgi:hypothetical protein